ncbi:HAMP domain-containing methyl-accepting chemotaxis protein (plasmid) [Leisingera caerulea]|uniref:HAMP domain-containing methyl-accepting chemotaxis protein n=1 Tax=Leisingera caerulea TaxID=506591 RepID=A0ABY5X3R3_LEICA|nr:HAMP domain-containing methyl-accepting chemotaxis protein [Leisingera caerulea]UWQ60914.1 HAMP domain-containing methyl-accepting chemotaxis protein [Leisingera caerulea]
MGTGSKSLLFRLTIPVAAVLMLCLAAGWLLIPRAIERNTVAAATDGAVHALKQIKTVVGNDPRHAIADTIASGALTGGVPGALSVYSASPVPGLAGPEMDGFMQAASDHLSSNPEGSYARVVTRDGKTLLRAAAAGRIAAGDADAPLVIELRQDITGSLRASAAIAQWILAALTLAGAILLAAVAVAARPVIRPLKQIRAAIEAVNADELDREIGEAGRKDEIGAIGRAIAEMQNGLKAARSAQEQHGGTHRQQQQQDVVDALRTGLSRLSKGDFTYQISGPFPEEHDGLRKDFNLTAKTLSSTVAQVVEASSSIRSGAAEISQASDDLSHRTESQAATLEQTAAALDQLTASVKSAAEGARSVEATMEEARTEAEGNHGVVQDAVAAMAEIEQSSNRISKILGVIDDIAFQTNLLALNAGVEAARAGEAGKGFAVVASEVRALAQRSADAATEIKTLIGDSSRHVQQGVDLVGKAGSALQSIVERVTQIAQLVSGIAQGAAEQSTGLSEINAGVTQLDQVTQQNAAMVEQATAAGHMLNSDATKLAELVAGFQAADGQAAPAAAPAAPPPPTAHGEDTWEVQASPAPAAAAAAARNLWQDF